MRIIIDDLTHPQVADLLQEHLAGMYANSPAECVFALDLAALKAPEITFMTAWEGEALLACGAFKRLDAQHAELKSMRTAARYVRRGVGRALLQALEAEARAQGIQRISLETGTTPAFAPAHQLYAQQGYQPCGPFAQYQPDPFSLFMSKSLHSPAI